MKITTGLEYQVKIDVCQSTGRVELTRYKNSVKIDLANNFKMGKETNETQYMENKRKTVLKSAKRIMQLVRYNADQYKKRNGSAFPPIFLTLTFTDNVQDWKFANREFSKFIQRLNYYVYGEKCSKLRYVGVPELQDRGAIHYHVLFFNLPYIDKDEIKKMWGLGKRTRIEQEKLTGMQGENLGRYITKYMTKQFYSKDKLGKDKFYYDKEIWEGKKVYFASRNLHRPSTFKVTNEEYFDLSWIFEGEECISEPIIASIKFDNGDSEIVELGIKEEYGKIKGDKLKFLMSVLSACNGRYIKSDFVIGSKKRECSKMIRLDKVIKESPKERYSRIKYNLDLDNKWDLICSDRFVEVDCDWIF